MLRYNLLFLLMAASFCPALAQNVVFTAVANANKIGTKDQLQVTFTVKDAKDLRSIMPGSFSDFNKLGGPYQTNNSSVNMMGNQAVMSQSVSVTYVLQAKHEGTCNITPAIAKDASGHTYQSNPLTIQVVPGTVMQQRPQRRAMRNNDPFGDEDEDPFAAMRAMQQQMQQMMQQQQQPQRAQPQAQANNQKDISQADIDKNLFIRVSVDKSKVHVGEQVTASYKLYTQVAARIAISKLPSLNGFWTQDFTLPDQNNAAPVYETLDGKKFQVYLLKKSALFPQQTGTLELDPAEAQGVAEVVQQINRGFFSTMGYRDVQVHLKSIPVKIEVTPAPEKGKPADFGGAVGKFTINDKIDKQEITTDDVATYTINITGSGNLKLIEAPKLTLPNGLNTYDPQILDTITGRSTTISGTKTITYAITPHTPGDYTIPSVPFSYFDPQAGTYTSLQAPPLHIHVTAGKHYKAPVSDNNNSLADIHNIVTRPLPEKQTTGKPLVFTAGYWSMYAVPFFAFIGLIVWKKKDEELSRDTILLRKKRANKIALQRLNTAKKLLQQNSTGPFYEEVSKAIWLYLSDKLNIPLSSLSRESANEAMSQRNVPAPLQQKLSDVVWECETALYATGGSKQMAHTYEQAVTVISELEDSFKA